MELRGTVQAGRREAAGFVSLPGVSGQLLSWAGTRPYPGTLNLRLEAPEDLARWRELRSGAGGWILPPLGTDLCPATCYPVLVQGSVPGTVVVPQVLGYPEDVVEVVASMHLRDRLGLEEGGPCRVRLVEDLRFECVAFDLEGTLVDFQWKLAEAEAELRAAAAGLGCDPALLARENYAGIRHRALDRAATAEARREVDRRFNPVYDRYDLDALSRWSPREGAAEVLRHLAFRGVRLALVSNIGRQAAHAALERFGLAESLGAVVTRDDVERMKPEPEGIRRALQLLGCDGPALMVGDSLSDLFAARNAGIPVAILAGGESDAAAIRAHSPEHRLSHLWELGPLATAPPA
ncbi:MAG: HAD-IA family hydrolase [Proteobacteria bacterium]|nr:HAD-IA family hydrolase [Pseudomonadota bacterium]